MSSLVGAMSRTGGKGNEEKERAKLVRNLSLN